MAVPKFDELFMPWLHALEGGEVHTSKDVKAAIAKEMQLSEADLTEMLPSGRQDKFSNRVGWARQYLSKAGLVVCPQKGQYQLTNEGKKILNEGQNVDLPFLSQYEGVQKFTKGSKKGLSQKTKVVSSLPQEQTPEDALEEAFAQLNANLASNLLDEVRKLTPTEFEKLVVELLLRMGYGSGIDDAGMVTKASNDGGIDGIIKEDQLGFSSIYIQAKQWKLDNTVSRPEIQKFAGALQGEKASKGLFITTAHFSDNAKQYAENLHGSTIVLVDGTQLARLMIKFNLGVSIEHAYEVKRIDTDFFAEEI